MRATIAILIIVFISNCAFSQRTKLDSSFVQIAKNQAVGLYEQTLKQQSHVYEGNEYISLNPRIKVHPYYVVDSLQTGTLMYNGVGYREVRMLYDIVRDELAVQPTGGAIGTGYVWITLPPFRWDPTNLPGLSAIVRLVSARAFMKLSIAERIKALAKRQKTIHEDISGGYYKADYEQQDRYIIQKDGAFYEVKTKGSVLNLFADRVKELRKYIRANHLKFKDEQREEAIARTTQRYDELMR